MSDHLQTVPVCDLTDCRERYARGVWPHMLRQSSPYAVCPGTQPYAKELDTLSAAQADGLMLPQDEWNGLHRYDGSLCDYCRNVFGT